MPEQMCGLKPTWQDQQWYEQQKERERAQQFAGQTGIVGKALIGLGGFAADVFAENSDHPIARMAIDMFGGLRSADYMITEGAKLTPGGQGEVVKQALEIGELATGAAPLAKGLAKAVPSALRAGAKDIQSLGVGQATLATLQEGIDRIPPMGPQLQVSLAGVGNFDSFVGPRMQQLGSPTVMKAVTTTDPEILAGVRGGIKTGAVLDSPEQTKQFIKRNKVIEQKKLRVSELNEQLTALKELENDPKNLQIYLNDNPEIKDIYSRKKGNMTKVYKSLNERKTDAQEALSQAQSNVLPFEKEGPNQSFFRTKQALDEKKLEESARAVKGFLEQHHRFPKGISAAYFDKMDDLISKGLAEKDDLIAMAEYAANQGRRTGDVRSNLLNMAKDPHNELHTILRKQGAEIPKSAIENMLKKVDNVDELMRQWKEVLAGDVAYNMDTAAIWEPLDDLLKQIQSK